MANTESIQIANILALQTEAVVPEIQQEKVDEVTVPIQLDNSYKGDELTRKVAEILNLPDLHGWSVVDSKDNLALVHYTDDSEKDVYGNLRGLLVDVEVGAVIADSFGYTPTAVSSELKETDGSFSVVDQEGVNHIFSVGDVIVRRVFEGVVLRVIWHKGQCYRISHKKINPIKSRWGSSKSFITMYEEAGGPTTEQLFDTSKPYSSTCYHFLVVDQSLLVGTRQHVNKPYLVFLSQRDMDIKRSADEVAVGIGSFPTNDINGMVSESFVHSPKQLSIDEANRHLKYGYYNEHQTSDERQLTGEAIIVYRMVDGAISDIVKIHSPAYEWRSVLRGNNPNIVHQFYSLLNMAYPDIKDWNEFTKKFVVLPLYDEESVKNLYQETQGILTIPSGEINRNDYSRRDSRIHLLWINYVLSLPPSVQGEALNILSNFYADRNSVIAWLQNLEFNNRNIEKTEYLPRVKGIISSARKLSSDKNKQGSNYTAKGKHMSYPMMIKNTIRNLINKESGPSLYALIREMKGPKEPKEPRVAEQQQ